MSLYVKFRDNFFEKNIYKNADKIIIKFWLLLLLLIYVCFLCKSTFIFNVLLIFQFVKEVAKHGLASQFMTLGFQEAGFWLLNLSTNRRIISQTSRQTSSMLTPATRKLKMTKPKQICLFYKSCPNKIQRTSSTISSWQWLNLERLSFFLKAKCQLWQSMLGKTPRSILRQPTLTILDQNISTLQTPFRRVIYFFKNGYVQLANTFLVNIFIRGGGGYYGFHDFGVYWTCKRCSTKLLCNFSEIFIFHF